MIYYTDKDGPHRIEKTEDAHMDELRTEKLLAQVRDRLGDAMAALELLTPLVESAGSGRDRKYLEAVNKSLYCLLRLIHHVDACTGKPALEERPIDLAGLCGEVGDGCIPIARRLGVRFTWSQTDSSVISLGDDHLLELAILNLLSNAFEAAGEGGQVSMTGKLEKGRWTVTVEDDGPGLQNREPPEDPFLKEPGGVGLGLVAARRVAELHGGVLVLNSAAGGGIRAVLSLPIRKPEPGLVREHRAEYRGGYSPILVEFAPLLPADCFSIGDT